MTDSEKAWAKENGLKRTTLKTCHGTNGYPSSRIIYRANDGRLYYKERGFWVGTFEQYCYETNTH